MTLHVCRDFLTLANPLTLQADYVALYLSALFCRSCLNYATVGNTNFNIDGAAFLRGNGTNGSINQGGSNTYAFSPDGYTVTSGDVGCILGVHSNDNPMVNSGLFRVSSVDTVNNWFILNYRSGDTPPVESGMSWRLFVNENIALNTNFKDGPNGQAGTYQGQGAATTSRLILQSPDASAWQVRFTVESTADAADTTFQLSYACTPTSIAPGFGGNASGDFAVAGTHLHGPYWFNTADANYKGTCVTLGGGYAGGQFRLYMWGDDSTGSVVAAVRNSFSVFNSVAAWGLCEDEEMPLPPKNVQRLFAYGTWNTVANHISWASGPSATLLGSGQFTYLNAVGFGLSEEPIVGVAAPYFYVSGADPEGFQYTPRTSLYAADNPYIAASELQTVDVVVGGWDVPNAIAQAQYLTLEVRRLGRFPFARLGRNNFGDFMVSTDPTHSWLQLSDGMYLPWQGSILP